MGTHPDFHERAKKGLAVEPATLGMIAQDVDDRRQE
jgi:hypothetical protein